LVMSQISDRKFKKIADYVLEYIYEVIVYYAGNRREASRVLGISERNLYNKLKKLESQGHDIPRSPFSRKDQFSDL
jgi:DNA-binding NtrC family response regulator